MAVDIPKPTVTVNNNNNSSNEDAAAGASAWIQGYRRGNNNPEAPNMIGDHHFNSSHFYEMQTSHEGGRQQQQPQQARPLQANIQQHQTLTSDSPPQAADFISIVTGTALGTEAAAGGTLATAATAEDEMTASQATAMIEDVLASGGDPKSLIGDIMQNSETIASMLGALEGPHVAANAWNTVLNAEQCFCKTLITHKQAGAIIGKNGAEIATMEKAAQVTAKVSPGGSYFPGTNDRIMVLCGQLPNIRAALQDVVSKFEFCNQVAQAQEDAKSTFLGTTNVPNRPRPLPMVLRLIVPNSSVGTLMGRQGKDIRQLAMTCGVHIQISPRLNGVLERIVNITGSASQCTLAGCAITEGIRGNPHVSEHANILIYTPYQHRQAAKQAETFNDVRAASGDCVSSPDSRISHYSSTATDGDSTTRSVVSGLPSAPKVVSSTSDYGQYASLLNANKNDKTSKKDEDEIDLDKLPPHIALQERLRRHLRCTIQTSLVKEARVRAAQLERELGPSILGLGPRPEFNLIVQAVNARMAAAASNPTTDTVMASTTAELYRRLLEEEVAAPAASVDTAVDEVEEPPT
ncbi:hypothetical protein FOZ63_028572, partial [Perkinsus olseni]